MTPVKQYTIEDLTTVSQPSSKSLTLTFSSLAAPFELHCGTADAASAILAKLESSKAAAGEALEMAEAEAAVSDEEPEAPKAVRFAETTPAAANSAGLAQVLYDFDAQGEDELGVQENEQVTVLDKENDEWWLVRNTAGHEGVVPAQYIQLGEAPRAEDEEDHEEEDHEEEERRREEEAAAAAASLEVERRRGREKKAEERRRIEAASKEKARQEEEDRDYALKLEEKEAAKAQRRAARRDEQSRQDREVQSEKR